MDDDVKEGDNIQNEKYKNNEKQSEVLEIDGDSKDIDDIQSSKDRKIGKLKHNWNDQEMEADLSRDLVGKMKISADSSWVKQKSNKNAHSKRESVVVLGLKSLVTDSSIRGTLDIVEKEDDDQKIGKINPKFV